MGATRTVRGDDYGIDRQATTDEKGNFRLKGVPPGSYVIAAYQQSEGEDVYEARGRQKIEVGGENIDSLTISLGGISIQGRVTVAGAGTLTLDRLRVGLSGVDEDGQFSGQGRVKKDGTFEIPWVSDGNFALYVQGLGDDGYVKSARLGSDDILETGLAIRERRPGRET